VVAVDEFGNPVEDQNQGLLAEPPVEPSPGLTEEPSPSPSEDERDEYEDKPKVAQGDLVPAGETSNAAAQNLLAERETHRLNGDDEAHDAVTEKLGELGFK
jgi:hypothetical protein